MKLMSYTLATIAGLCFMSGIFILTSEGDINNGEIRDTFRLN